MELNITLTDEEIKEAVLAIVAKQIAEDLDVEKYSSLKYVTRKEVKAVIQDMPTIEPKHGEWTPIHKGERGFSAGDFRCSVCHQPNKCYTMTNYCSHCGAYMKPTEKNDQ